MILFDDEIKNLFIEKLQTLITTGEVINHQKSLESKTVVTNADGEVIKTLTTNKTERNTTVLPTPLWVLQMIDRNLSTQEAIKTCQQAGYIVIDPSRIDEDEELAPGGLSEFAVHEIRAKLLGIES